MAIIVTLQNATFKETCFPFPLALMHETFQVGHIAGKEGEVRWGMEHGHGKDEDIL